MLISLFRNMVADSIVLQTKSQTRTDTVNVGGLLMESIELIIPHSGYKITSRETTIAREEAPFFLTPCLQKSITKAIRNESTITLLSHFATCPCCGKEIPAYADFITDKQLFCAKEPDEIEEWSTYQLSLFGEAPQEMLFNHPLTAITNYACRKCGQIFRKSSGERKVAIRKQNKKITVELELKIEDLFRVYRAKDLTFDCSKIYESIVFNSRNGHTYLTLNDKNGKRYSTTDITGANLSFFEKEPVFDIIENYKPVFSELKRLFSTFFNGHLPFSDEKMNIEKYILLNRFIGYDISFYKSLPFAERENMIEKSFSNTAKKLHRATSVPALLKTCLFPDSKSIRRIVFNQPALMFYLNELENIWLLLNEINYFRMLFETTKFNIFELLAYLHKHTPVFSFLREYAEDSGPEGIFDLLTDKTEYLYKYAPFYLSMSEHAKNEERKKWKKTGASNTPRNFMISVREWNYSIPTPAKKENNLHLPPDCSISGYSFRRLFNSEEYKRAGDELNNCLKNWRMFRGTVYGITHKGKYVAAAELDGKTIKQAYTFSNRDIDKESALGKVFCIWKKQNGLSQKSR